MRRYRVLSFDFDTRAQSLIMEIRDDWDPKVKENHLQNRLEIIKSIEKEYGEMRLDEKIANFRDLGSKPVSIFAYHNAFLHQIRNSFIIGAYYPALTAACALGERILNHLVLKLREDFRHTPEYKRVYSKESFDNWDIPISVLGAWEVLLPEVVKSFRKLNQIRNRTIHFDPGIDADVRTPALEAIHTLEAIIGQQFSAFGPRPWFITGVPGEIYIKKEWEKHPFVARIYLPNCCLLSPYHHLDFDRKNLQFIPIEENEVENREITDDEFVVLRRASNGKE